MKSAIKLALEGAALTPARRSRSEDAVAAQLSKAGIAAGYETVVVRYAVPAREAKYLPDFNCPGGIILEVKGRFGHRGNNAAGAKERQKMALVKEQHPHLDIRFVFDNSEYKIYKGSPTTYAKWAEDHGFLWADKKTIPQAWINEMKGSK